MQQRAGAMQEAMAEYELLISAATSSGAPPESLAEVYTNLGQLKAKSGDRSRARELFKLALDTRSLATAHTNLALLDLAEGGSSPGMVSVPALRSGIAGVWEGVCSNRRCTFPSARGQRRGAAANKL